MTFPRNRFVGFFLLVAAVSVLPCRLALGQGQAVDAQSTIAFIGVNVIPLTDGNTVLADQTVVVRNGSIVAIGPRARVAVPANATQIAAAVKYLMPGLADMHVHLEHFDNPVYLQLFLANGITSVRSMDGIPEILEAKRNAAAGTLLSPAIYTAGPVLDGDPPTRPEIRSVRNPDEARSAVLEQASAGYDFIKIYPNLSAESFRAIIRTAKERGLRVAGHLPIAERHLPMVAERGKRVFKPGKRVAEPGKRVLRHLETCFGTRETRTRIPGSANRYTGNVLFYPGNRVREHWKRV